MKELLGIPVKAETNIFLYSLNSKIAKLLLLLHRFQNNLRLMK